MVKILEKPKHKRADGWLSELWTKEDWPSDFKMEHSYLVSIEPGSVRAKHYHNKKLEVISCIFGSVEIFLEDISSKKRQTIILDSENKTMALLVIEPQTAHAIKNPTKNIARIIVFSNSHDLSDVVPYEFKNLE